MPATYTAEVLGSRAERRMVDFDPDATTKTLVDLVPDTTDECLPIAQFRRFMAGLFRSVGSDVVSAFEIIAATDADGSDAAIVVSHSFDSDADAVGDYVWLECDAEQVREVLSTATHVGVRVQLDTATDECVVYFERADPYYPRTGLTADFIA